MGKLVRDKDIDLIAEREGRQPNSHVLLDREERIRARLNKVMEEAVELYEDAEIDLSGSENRQKIIEEMGDVLDAVFSLAPEWNISDNEIAHARKIKYQARGGFEKGLHLDE